MIPIHAEMADAGLGTGLAEPVNQAVAGAKDGDKTRIGQRHGLCRHRLQRGLDGAGQPDEGIESRIRQKPGQFVKRLAKGVDGVFRSRRIDSLRDKRTVHYHEAGCRRLSCQCTSLAERYLRLISRTGFFHSQFAPGGIMTPQTPGIAMAKLYFSRRR